NDVSNLLVGHAVAQIMRHRMREARNQIFARIDDATVQVDLRPALGLAAGGAYAQAIKMRRDSLLRTIDMAGGTGELHHQLRAILRVGVGDQRQYLIIGQRRRTGTRAGYTERQKFKEEQSQKDDDQRDDEINSPTASSPACGLRC